MLGKPRTLRQSNKRQTLSLIRNRSAWLHTGHGLLLMLLLPSFQMRSLEGSSAGTQHMPHSIVSSKKCVTTYLSSCFP